MHTHTLYIQPALMADEWSVLVAQIERLRGVASRMQIDVMDGELVPSRSFPYNQSILGNKELPYRDEIEFEVHLMVKDPQEAGIAFIQAGCKRVVAQLEGFGSTDDIDAPAVRNALHAWRAAGATHVGLSVMLDTPLDLVTPFLDAAEIDVIQVMSIARIGYQGERLDDRALMRIRTLRTRYPHVIIAVDGGIHAETITDVALAGAHVASVGSALVGSAHPKDAYELLTRAAGL